MEEIATLLLNYGILGSLEFKEVPETLKKEVKKILDESGVGFLTE